MAIYLIDSDVLIDFFKKRKYAVELIAKLAKEQDLAISILSVAELRSGWSSREAKFFLPRLYKLVDTKAVTKKVAELAGELRAVYKRKGVVLSTIDILIAATCILVDCYLVTKNRKHYPMPGIKFYNL